MRVSVAFSLGKVVRLSSHGCDLCLLCLVSVGTVLVCGTALPAEASAARRHTRKREERLRKENGEKDSKQVCKCDGKRLPRRRFLDAQCNDACRTYSDVCRSAALSEFRHVTLGPKLRYFTKRVLGFSLRTIFWGVFT